ncbi:hypothetical protein [Bradyrhizobium sp. CW1]|uniref:hypothetical protein n=1 Tax=Bradyrhizobium sp. CW1 TaxID=2782686 RepID=UPI001FFED5E3|nr:hypothetical protein [Bradyrhizobium sp. CW1]UPJ31594.1 hypothetical protein IVB54_15535 [Bradyrhizobium sp. CW1]
MIRFALIGLLMLLLAGCASKGPASIAGGECRIFERPQYEVRGKRDYDQDWIDSQVEGGVGGCHWKRPAARPASIDAAPGHKAAPAPVKRKSFVRRIRDRVLPPKVEIPAAPAAIAPAPAAASEPAPAAAPPAPRPPRSAIEKLLQPRDDD